MNYLRLFRGTMTQLELAESAGCAQSAVAQIESGARRPSVPLALKLANAVGRSVQDVFPEMAAIVADISRNHGSKEVLSDGSPDETAP